MFETALERAERFAGDGEAFVCGTQRINWETLTRRAKAIAASYREMGLVPGDRVAALLPNGLPLISLFAASAYSGTVIVPINYRWNQREVAFALEDCTPRLFVFDDLCAEIARSAACGLDITLIDAGEGTGGDALPFAALYDAQPIPSAPFPAEHPLGIFYTGGTTGRSKGVVLSRGNVFSNAMACTAEGMFGEGVTFMHSTPMFHIAGALCLHGAFISASRNIVLDKFDAGEALALIEKERVNQTLWVPTMIGAVTDHPAAAKSNVSSMKNIAYGAAPITPTTLRRAMAMFTEARFTQLYGMTETSPTASVLHSAVFSTPGGRPELALSSGRPIFGTEIRITGPDGTERPRGEVGEIAIRGPGVMLGYWNMPEATAKAVVDGWMHTGDGGRMDEQGFVYLADRIKDMIITGGENVFSIEVENVIAAHPAVRQCAVIGIPHERWGEAVHAIIVLHDDKAASYAEIAAHCRANLTGFKIPRSVEIRGEPLPLSAAGKILKRELRAPYWEGTS